MAGTLMRLLPKTKYNFSNLGVSESPGGVLYIAQNINVSQWREATLMVRLHEASWANGAEVVVGLIPVAPTEEAPGVVFGYGAGGASATLQEGVTPNESLTLASMPSNFGAFASLTLEITQGTQAVTFEFTISVDLSLKD